MKKAAIVINGEVVNVVVLPDDWTGKAGDWSPPSGIVVVSDEGEIGDTYNGTKFIKPPPPPPPPPQPPDPRRVDLEARIDVLGVLPELKAILKELI